MSENTAPVSLSQLPRGAKFRILFEGELISGSEDSGFVEFLFGGDRVKLDWELLGDPVEEYSPEIEVLDFGFKPGDVASVETTDVSVPASQATWECLFAVGTPSGTSSRVRWIDSKGEVRTVNPAQLHLVARNGFAVRNPLDD